MNTVSVTQYVTKFHQYMYYLNNVPQHPVNVAPHWVPWRMFCSILWMLHHTVLVPWREFHSILWMLHHTVWLSSMNRVPQHPVNVTSHCLTEFREQSSTASCECYITLSDWVPWTQFHSILWMLHHTVWVPWREFHIMWWSKHHTGQSFTLLRIK